MVFSCDNCSAALQIDEAKAPVGKFTIRCPKCKNLVRVQIRGENKSVASEPQPESKSWDSIPKSAAAYKADNIESENQPALDSNDLLRALASMLQPHGSASSVFSNEKKAHRKNVLLCLPDKLKELAARSLSEAGYQVFPAEAPPQALETMRENNINVVILSPDFCSQQKGTFVLQKHFSTLTATQRRNFFLISLEDTVHTYDSHEAFMRNLNLVIHSNDTRNLPTILRRAFRDYDEMYRYFNEAMEV